VTELATVGPSSGALAVRADQHQWTEEQRAALAQIGVDKARPGDLQVFMHVAQRTGLDPFSRQIYMIERGGKQTIQTGIDGLRVIAQRRSEYAGQSEPQWCGDDGIWRDIWTGSSAPVAARVQVYRHDWTQPVTGIAHFTEFTAGNSMWKSKPAHMLAKCAEALALRKAFPNDLAGLTTPEETDRDDLPRRARTASGTAAVTVHELTGGTVVDHQPPAEQGDERMSTEQQKRLFALIREHEIADRADFATGVLGREITSFGQLSKSDASRLMDAIEHGAQDAPTRAQREAEQDAAAGEDQ
jgi:phage recombination protein Bet